MQIKLKLIFTFLTISLLTLAISNSIFYFYEKDKVRQVILNQMDSVASIQHSRILGIYNQNLERLRLVASRTQLRISLGKYIENGQSIHQDKMNRIIADAKKSIPDFKSISIFSLDGTIVASTNKDKMGSKNENDATYISGMKKNRVDLFSRDKNNRLLVFFSGPLYLDNKLLGVISIKSSVENIAASIGDYTGLGETGETILVSRSSDGDAIFLMPTRFNKNAALTLVSGKKELRSSVDQSLSKKILISADTLDYRGQPTLAATRYINKAKWGLVVKIDRKEAFAHLTNMRNILLGILIIASGIVIIASIFLSRAITLPISRLTEVAKQIARGDLSIKADAASNNEVGVLGRTFNEMTDSLSQVKWELENKVNELLVADAKLQNLNDSLQERINQRTRELKEAQELLLRNEKLAAVGQLASSIAHELRNPLGVISNSTYFLNMSIDNAGDKIKKHLAILKREVDRSNAIITDLLNFSRALDPAVERTDINNIVESALSAVEHSDKIKVKIHLDDHLPTITGDSGQLNQVFQNIISNAYQAMPDGGALDIKTILKDNFVEATVTDTGGGITEDNLGKIFEPLYTTKTQGIGLGLSIVHGIIDKHNGHIEVSSELNKGTAFTVKLPAQIQI